MVKILVVTASTEDISSSVNNFGQYYYSVFTHSGYCAEQASYVDHRYTLLIIHVRSITDPLSSR